MEPMVEGGVEVTSPPCGAGRRGRGDPRDWGVITEEVKRRAYRWFRFDRVDANTMARLPARYPEFEFVGHDYRLHRTKNGPEVIVCDVYVRLDANA